MLVVVFKNLTSQCLSRGVHASVAFAILRISGAHTMKVMAEQQRALQAKKAPGPDDDDTVLHIAEAHAAEQCEYA